MRIEYLLLDGLILFAHKKLEFVIIFSPLTFKISMSQHVSKFILLKCKQKH